MHYMLFYLVVQMKLFSFRTPAGSPFRPGGRRRRIRRRLFEIAVEIAVRRYDQHGVLVRPLEDHIPYDEAEEPDHAGVDGPGWDESR